MPVVVPEDPVTFATAADLAVRLGRDLTTAESGQADLLLVLATGLITDAVGRDSEWADGLGPVPAMLRAVCLEMVARVLQNPSGARSESETLGQYQHSASFTDDAHSLMLTDAETLLCRRTVLGQTSGSACVDSLITRLATSYVVDEETSWR